MYIHVNIIYVYVYINMNNMNIYTHYIAGCQQKLSSIFEAEKPPPKPPKHQGLGWSMTKMIGKQTDET